MMDSKQPPLWQKVSFRPQRIAEEIAKVLAEALNQDTKNALLSYELHGLFLSVEEVRLSSDKRHARVWVESFPLPDIPKLMAALKEHTPFLRSVIGRKVVLRRVPELSFSYVDANNSAMYPIKKESNDEKNLSRK